MKNHLISFFSFLVFAYLIFAIHVVSSETDYTNKIIDLINHEDNRDTVSIAKSYGYPVKFYWGNKNISKPKLLKLYLKAWKNVDESSNLILSINKLSEFEYVLKTRFAYKMRKKEKVAHVLSEVKFFFDKEGEIYGVENIKSNRILKHDSDLMRAKQFDYFWCSTSSKERHKIIILICVIILFFCIPLLNNNYIKWKTEKELKRLEEEKVEKLREENERKILEERRIRILGEEKERERLEQEEIKRLWIEKQKKSLHEEKIKMLKEENEKKKLKEERELQRLIRVEEEEKWRALKRKKEDKELLRLEKDRIENEKSIKDENGIMKYMTVIDDEIDDEKSNSNNIDIMKYMTEMKKDEK